MKKFKKIIIGILFTISCLTCIQTYAESNLKISRKTFIYTDDRKEAKFYTNKGYAYCITPHKTGPDQGTVLRYKGDQTNGGLLYLLENAGTSDSEYLATQLAIWLYDSNYMPDFYTSHSNYAVVKKAQSLAAEASRHGYSQNTTSAVKITTSSSTFTETSDGKYYKSGIITLTSSGATSINLSIESAPSGTIIVNSNNQTVSTITKNDKFYVMVPVDSVTTSATVSLKATATAAVSRVERYTTGESQWQELIVLTKTNKTTSSTAKLTVTPVTRYCQYSNGKYYGKNGKVVTREQYAIECEKHTCEKVGNTYFGKSGNVVTSEQYDIECNKHTCEKVGNTYFGKSGNVVTSEQYDIECNKHTCEKVGDTYFGKSGNVVTSEQYDIECNKHTCEKVGNTYFGKDGKEVSYSEYTLQCEKHTCEFINGKYFGIQGFEVSKEQYIKECIHTCEIYNNQYYDKNGKVVSESEYKEQCETQVVPVPNTGSMSDIISIIIGASFLGTVAGIIAHNNKKKNA